MSKHSTNPSIELVSVTKRYGDKTVIDNLSLFFSKPGLYSIVGASGSGKTTLLSLMCGFERPTSGTIKKKGKVGFVFQESNLLSDFSVIDNIKIVGADENDALKLLEHFGLAELANTKANLLSGGEKQRVAVVRCLGMDSDFLVLDEPTGSLDKENAVKLFDQLKEISKEKVVIVVTHDRELAKTYSDIIFDLKDGKAISNKETEKQTTEDVCEANEEETSPVLSKYRLKYAFNLIKGKIGFFIASVILFTLSLTLEFFCLSFTMYDKAGTVYEASKVINAPYYSVSKVVVNEPTDKKITVNKGLVLENEISKAIDASPLLIRSNLQPKEKAIAPNVPCAWAMYASDWSFGNISGSLPSSNDEIVISDFAGEYLFGSKDIIGKTLTFSVFAENDTAFKVSAVIDTGYSEESFSSFFFDEAFQQEHFYEYISKYLTFYCPKDTGSKMLFDKGIVSLHASNFANAESASSYTNSFPLKYTRGSLVEGLPALTGSNIVVSEEFVNKYFADSPIGHSFSYPDIYNALNRNLYLELMNLYDLYPEVKVVGVSDMGADVAVSDDFFEKISQSYLPFVCDHLGVSISSRSQIEALDNIGVSFEYSSLGLVYDAAKTISDFAPSLYVVDGIILAIVILASFLVFSSLINRKMHEFAILRCLGASNKKIAGVFAAYLVVSLSLCFVLSVVAGSVLQVVLESFLKNSVFHVNVPYALFLWNPLSCLGLLATCLVVGLIIVLFPLVKIAKIDSGILLKKSV